MIGKRLQQVQKDVVEFCDRNGLQHPLILAVSKTRSVGEIMKAYDLGIRDFGENYAKEMSEKASAMPKDINWHFIGHLQRSNVKYIVEHASVFHCLDSLKLSRRLENMGFKGQCYIQVNISGEESKSGVRMDQVKEILEGSNLNIVGLMCIPSPAWDSDKLVENYRKLWNTGLSLGLNKFSWGMSADWKEALLSGSNCVRIGTAIFGPR